MQIGRKIYRNAKTLQVIWDKGEMSGNVKETTWAEDCQTMPEINIPDIETIKYEYGTSSEIKG